MISQYGSSNLAVYITVGYGGMNSTRETIYRWLVDNNIEVKSYVHPSCYVSKGCGIGFGNIFLENVVVQPYVSIGNCNIFFSNTTICHHSTVNNFNYFSPGSVMCGRVSIGSRNFLGANCTVRNDIVIGDKNLVGAHSYLSCDIGDDEIIKANRLQRFSGINFRLK